MTQMKRRHFVSILVAAALPRAASAEVWPTLNNYVDQCVLIVLCRTEPFKDGFRYKIEETWKGVYSPELFYYKPDEGYLYAGSWHGNEGQKGGARTVFFFTASNSPDWAKGKLVDHSTSFQIKDGKLTYALTGDWGVPKDYTVEEFRKAILERGRRKLSAKPRLQIQDKK